MTERESAIKKSIMLLISNVYKVAIFTNPVGTGWVGKFIRKNATDGLVLQGARQISYGMYNGSPDLIGWKKIIVTPQMVGCTLAVFVGIETKDAKGKLTPEQQNFLDRLVNDGALAGVARNDADAIEIVTRLERL
jgi:hypothetical protein